ncbi:Gaa1-like protein [Lactarius quietus]|nr:Gaa1-like protein [Lactarius quietus]
MSSSEIPPVRLVDRIKRLISSGDAAAAVGRYLDIGSSGKGCLWLFSLPLSMLQTGTYIDENALQPGQVPFFLEDVTSLRDRNSSSSERATFFATEFAKCGYHLLLKIFFPTARGVSLIHPDAHVHDLTSSRFEWHQCLCNLLSPRTSGTEAMLTDGYNLRGVSTVLSLAAFMKHYSHWSKDIIFVISDNHLDGMHAWLSAYHTPTSPGVFREGLNGRLPNQDLINSFGVISQHTGNVPVLLYDHYEPSGFPGREQIRNFFPSWLPNWIWDIVTAKNILKHFAYQAKCRASGHTGFSTSIYRIDAITLFAVPSNGPHGFHALGRTVESTMQTPCIFFFYIMTSPSSFLKIGSYLPSVVLIAASLMFGVNDGLWPLEKEKYNHVARNSSKKKWVTRRRELLGAFMVVVTSHLVGLSIFVVIICEPWLDTTLLAYILPPVWWATLSLCRFALQPSSASANAAPLSALLKAINMCLASTLISVTSVLNFSLAALLAITLGVPLSFASPSRSLRMCIMKSAVYATLALAIWDWQVLGVWFAPLVCLIYVPFVLQAGVVSCLEP